MDSNAVTTLQNSLLAELATFKKYRNVAIKAQDPEGVHQLRVSLRRMRSALIVFRPLIKPDYRRRWGRKLKRLARQLDEARDLDVLLLTHFSDDSTDHDLHQALLKKQKQVYRQLARSLRSSRFKKPIRQLKKQLKKANWPDKYCRRRHMTLSELARIRLETLYNRVIEQQQAMDVRDETALHQLRISFKQLRYGCEFLAPVLDSEQNAIFLASIKVLQDQLGEIHDACVQQDMLTKLPDHTLQNLQPILAKARLNSIELKQALPESLQLFRELGKPWDGLRTVSESA